MEAAARSRDAARDAVQDVTPVRLRDVIDGHLAESSAVPGALTVLSHRAVAGGETDGSDGSGAERAAGVQLIYEGLRLTRSLVAEDPWADDPEPDISADVDVIAADVLVARGFRLLARTEAAGLAVETVRAFGRSQTPATVDDDGDSDDAALATEGDDQSLERSVFELAVVAGATAGGRPASAPLREYAIGLARARDPPLAAAGESLPPDIAEEFRRRASAAERGGDAPSPAKSVNRND